MMSAAWRQWAGKRTGGQIHTSDRKARSAFDSFLYDRGAASLRDKRSQISKGVSRFSNHRRRNTDTLTSLDSQADPEDEDGTDDPRSIAAGSQLTQRMDGPRTKRNRNDKHESRSDHARYRNIRREDKSG